MNPNDLIPRAFVGTIKRPMSCALYDLERMLEIDRRAVLGLGSSNGGRTPVPAPTKEEQIASAEQRVADLKAEKKAEDKAAAIAVKEAEAAAEAAQVKADLKARLEYERGLASGTAQLLAAITDIELHNGKAGLSSTFAKYRDELSALAGTYGYKIVLVGDKSVAVLTK